MSQSTALQKTEPDAETLKKILFKGDLSNLTPEEQIAYYIQRCERLGLDPYSKPFDFLEVKDKETGQRKVTLYANKEASAQLTVNRGISIEKLEDTEENGVYRVKAYVRTSDGRTGVNLSVAKVKGLEGKNYANAVKSATTQAIRRAILMICGLGDTDETEVPDIPNARPLPYPEAEIMTPGEAKQLEAMTIEHKAIGLDQWSCSRSMAMLVINICKRMEEANIPEEMWRAWLPAGVQSRKELSDEQAQAFVSDVERRMKLNSVCAKLSVKGVDRETMRQKLSGISAGIVSLKDLNSEQVEKALKEFTYWLNTYNEVVEGSVVNAN
jgi:hypothetical protein